MYLALRRGREMGAHCAPLRKKKSSAVLLFEAVAALRFSPDYPKGKGVIHKRVETVGVYPLVRPRGVSALPAEVQRKSPARQGRTRLRQFVCPGQPVQKRSRPPGGEHANAVRMPRKLGAEKGARLAASPKERG